MKDGLPTIYWFFRWGWSALHLFILAALATAFFVWARTDFNLLNALNFWVRWIDDLRRFLGDLIPYPWS